MANKPVELARLLAGRENTTDRKMLFVGWLNSKLAASERAVLVGGSLVQFYSGGAYESVDIDLVTQRRDPLRSILSPAGFKEDVRGFEHLELELVVDVSTKGLRPTEKVVVLQYEGWNVPVVSLEDAIVDRLFGAKFWRSGQDWEQAVLIYGANRERVDEAELSAKARANDVLDFAERLSDRNPEASPDRRRGPAKA